METKTMPALGRLGKLYDCRSDQLIPETLPTSQTEEVITTADNRQTNRLARSLIKHSPLEKAGQPSIYMLPTAIDQHEAYKKHTMGKENPLLTHKVIMMMGGTGSGKTTLINGMINYILGVKWNDDFRFKLIREVLNESQAHSQTAEVTAYEIHAEEGFQIPYSLTIIDTPGFGDTRGIEQDRKITEQIRDLFSKPGGIDHIDVVCFVVQAAIARLTPAQKYVFDSVLSIFGKDIKENIQLLITFTDGASPPVLDAIKASDIPCPKDEEGKPINFKFNNSALFANNGGKEEANPFNFNEMFWKMGTMSMETFFTTVDNLVPKSLTLTKEVLKERKQLEAAVQGLLPQIKAGLVKLEEKRKTERALEQHRDEMNANKDFEYEVEITYQEKIKVTGFITNCNYCHYTCHYPCYIGDDTKKHTCDAMSNGNCVVCPGKCHWKVHYNQPYKFEYKVKKETRTFADLKRKYEEASGEVMTTVKMFEQLQCEYNGVMKTVSDLIEKSSASLRRLQEIALKPNTMATSDYIDLLIQTEERELKEGYQERLKSLHEIKEQAVIISKIANKEELLPEEKKKLSFIN